MQYPVGALDGRAEGQLAQLADGETAERSWTTSSPRFVLIDEAGDDLQLNDHRAPRLGFKAEAGFPVLPEWLPYPEPLDSSRLGGEDLDLLIAGMRSEYRRTLEEIRAKLAEQIGDPPSIGLLHRWISEAKEEERRR